MESRSLNELYKLLLTEFTENGMFICCSIDLLYIIDLATLSESLILKKHFRSQFPTKDLHSKFYKTKLFKDKITGSWWSHIQTPVRGRQIRIDFINEMILITK